MTDESIVIRTYYDLKEELSGPPSTFFLELSRGDASAILEANPPKVRKGRVVPSPWHVELDKAETAGYLMRMNAGNWPAFAAVLRFASQGELLTGRQVLEAFVASCLAVLRCTVITGLSAAAEFFG